jgi:hypothetical protein
VNLVCVEFIAFRMKGFDETTHVSAFESSREVDGERDIRDGVLLLMRFVAEVHRKAEAFNSNAIDGYLSVIRFVLGIFEGRLGLQGHFGRFLSQSTEMGRWF